MISAETNDVVESTVPLDVQSSWEVSTGHELKTSSAEKVISLAIDRHYVISSIIWFETFHLKLI